MGQKIKVGERIKKKFSLTGDNRTEKELLDWLYNVKKFSTVKEAKKFKRLIYNDANLKLERKYNRFSPIEDIV